MKTAVIYARYSSHNQRDVSIDQQVAACRKYADAQHLSVLRVYADRAMTGTNDNRPEFRQMIKDSSTGSFDYVIVYQLDRFSRDRYDSAVHKHALKENGVKVLSAMEHITDDPTGILMESILEGFAEYYSKELAQKIKRGLKDNAEKCMVACALPYGYVKGPDGRFAIDEGEAAIVREIFDRVLAHESYADIFRDLNARGLRTKRGALWGRSSFNKILANERYIGTYIYGDTRIENGVPAIIDPDIFWAVQNEMTQRANPRGVPGRRRGKTTYHLTGKAFCGLCKSPLVGTSGTSKNGQLHTYYACRAQLREKACSKKQIAQGKLEYIVAEALRNFALDDDLIEQFVDHAVELPPEDPELDNLRQRLKAVEASIANLIRAIEKGISSDDITDRLKVLSADKRQLQAQISEAELSRERPFTREELIAAFQLLREGQLENLNFQELLFDMFLHSVYVYEDSITIVFNYAKNGRATLDLPFDVDSIPEVACSDSSKWWPLAASIRTFFIGSYCVIRVSYPRVA